MAFTEAMFVLCTPSVPRSCRLFLVVFLVRMWRLNACPRLTLPEPRTRKRFAALFLVFILGMMPSDFLLMPCKVSGTTPELGNPLGFFTRPQWRLWCSADRSETLCYFLRFGAITMII